MSRRRSFIVLNAGMQRSELGDRPPVGRHWVFQVKDNFLRSQLREMMSASAVMSGQGVVNRVYTIHGQRKDSMKSGSLCLKTRCLSSTVRSDLDQVSDPLGDDPSVTADGMVSIAAVGTCSHGRVNRQPESGHGSGMHVDFKCQWFQRPPAVHRARPYPWQFVPSTPHPPERATSGPACGILGILLLSSRPPETHLRNRKRKGSQQCVVTFWFCGRISTNGDISAD